MNFHDYSVSTSLLEKTMCDKGTQYEMECFQDDDMLPFCRTSSPAYSDACEYTFELNADGNDLSYIPDESHNDSSFLNSSCIDDIKTTKTEMHEENKYIVFESMLDMLIRFCPKCGSLVSDIRKFLTGSMIGVQYTCNNNCSDTWRSQPLLRGMPAGNLLLCGAILYSGGQYSKFADIASIMQMPIPSSSTYFRIQEAYLFPVVEAEYNLRQEALLAALAGELVFLCGDGQCDSPGHTAKYLAYMLIDKHTDFILSSQIVCVAEVANSNAMEVEGLARCISIIEDHGVSINGIATDRQPQVTYFMKTQKSDMSHQFDIFHVAKGITKELSRLAKNKDCSDIYGWIQSISNHLWWSCKSCEGNADVCIL